LCNLFITWMLAFKVEIEKPYFDWTLTTLVLRLFACFNSLLNFKTWYFSLSFTLGQITQCIWCRSLPSHLLQIRPKVNMWPIYFRNISILHDCISYSKNVIVKGATQVNGHSLKLYFYMFERLQGNHNSLDCHKCFWNIFH
jgi:hypothetical protein